MTGDEKSVLICLEDCCALNSVILLSQGEVAAVLDKVKRKEGALNAQI